VHPLFEKAVKMVLRSRAMLGQEKAVPLHKVRACLEVAVPSLAATLGTDEAFFGNLRRLPGLLITCSPLNPEDEEEFVSLAE
jgi:hypothetical protein